MNKTCHVWIWMKQVTNQVTYDLHSILDLSNGGCGAGALPRSSWYCTFETWTRHTGRCTKLIWLIFPWLIFFLFSFLSFFLSFSLFLSFLLSFFCWHTTTPRLAQHFRDLGKAYQSLRCVAVCCSVLVCVAVFCSVLKCALETLTRHTGRCSVLQCCVVL